MKVEEGGKEMRKQVVCTLHGFRSTKALRFAAAAVGSMAVIPAFMSMH